MSRDSASKTTRHRRRGSMYIAVLGTSLLVTVIGLSALMLTRIERRSTGLSGDFMQARLHARTAIEMGIFWTKDDPDWRNNRPVAGAWVTDQLIGTGTFTLEVNDPDDADLQAEPNDNVVMTGTGKQGQARYKLEVTLIPDNGTALTCLEVAMHAGTDLLFDAITVQCDQIVSANNNVVTSGFTAVNADVEAVGTISGSGYRAGRSEGISPRTMPDTTVFDYYLTNGTTINLADIPNAQGKKTIQEVLMSPANNPYPPGGPTNPEGIYVIDCQGGFLRVRNARIVGTLVILNPSTFSVQQSVTWDAALTNYPALLVSGNADLAFVNTALSESAAGTNFNPASTPYEGAWNTDTADTYPSLIKGLIYVSGGLTTQNYVTIDGVLVVGNTSTSSDDLDLTYRPTYLDSPPPGFGTAGSGLQIVAGSWKRVVD